MLLFNETIDDKRLGLWLKSALDGSDRSPGMAKAKTDMIADYVKSWRFVYAVYHGKCFSWALSHFYGDDEDTDDVSMSYASWQNVLYVAVHIGFLDLQFHFRPFDRHFEVHRRYCISSQGSQYLYRYVPRSMFYANRFNTWVKVQTTM